MSTKLRQILETIVDRKIKKINEVGYSDSQRNPDFSDADDNYLISRYKELRGSKYDMNIVQSGIFVKIEHELMKRGLLHGNETSDEVEKRKSKEAKTKSQYRAENANPFTPWNFKIIVNSNLESRAVQNALKQFGITSNSNGSISYNAVPHIVVVDGKLSWFNNQKRFDIQDLPEITYNEFLKQIQKFNPDEKSQFMPKEYVFPIWVSGIDLASVLIFLNRDLKMKFNANTLNVEINKLIDNLNMIDYDEDSKTNMMSAFMDIFKKKINKWQWTYSKLIDIRRSGNKLQFKIDS